MELTDIPVDQIHRAQQAAVIRLQLYTVGRVHALMAEQFDPILADLRNGGDEPAGAAVVAQTKSKLLNALERFSDDYSSLLSGAMDQAVQIPLGALAVLNDRVLLPALAEVEEALTVGSPLTSFLLSVLGKEILAASIARRGADNANLSGRIWRLELDGRLGIDRVLVDGLAKGQSPWRLAQRLEKFLGYGVECPRWVKNQLSDHTNGDLDDLRTLLSGRDCEQRGVAYNAIRLARTETSYVMNAMTDALFARMPWVTAEKISTSPGHSKIDICDEVASGGDNGDGVYPVGTNVLPFHPNCQCVKEAVLMSASDLAGRLRSWLGGGTWPKMDQYKSDIGGQLLPLIGLAAVGALVYWLSTREPEIE